MANAHDHRNIRPQAVTAIGLITLAVGAIYVGLAAMFFSNLEWAADYLRPSLESEGLTGEFELAFFVIAGQWISSIAGAFGIIIGFGVLKAKRWSWDAAAVYNIIFVLCCAYAFAERAELPDSYLGIASAGAVALLFRRSTKEHFGRLRIPQK